MVCAVAVPMAPAARTSARMVFMDRSWFGDEKLTSRQRRRADLRAAMDRTLPHLHTDMRAQNVVPHEL